MKVLRLIKVNPSLILGLLISLALLFIAVFAPIVATHPVGKMDMRHRLEYPSGEHILGTDNFGRDLWSRLAYGSRISLTIAIFSVAMSATLGTLIGLCAGYFGGFVDQTLMRIVDVFLGFPAMILALALVVVLGPGIFNVTIALAVIFWTQYARVVHALALSIRESDYVVAARALGASHTRILLWEMLPNVLGPVIVLATLGMGIAIIAESGLSFLGFGVTPPTPTWGWILAYGSRFLRASPWMSTISGLFIMMTVLGFNLLGDGLRDILDPKGVTRQGRK